MANADTSNTGIVGLLGDTLRTKEGIKDTREVLEGKDYVLLYFGADWCPPCHKTLPKLREYYEKHKESKNLELVFVSADREESKYESYFDLQPWKAVPWDGPRSQLQSRLSIQGYPTVMVLGKDGEVISKDAVEDVLMDPDGEMFPYRPKGLWDILEGQELQVRGPKGESTMSASELRKYDYIGLYFSAHWCAPCRSFTPRLNEWYEANASKHNMVIVFVSSDRETSQFHEYHDSMSWPALDFAHDNFKTAARQLSKLCGVRGIPALAFFEKSGEPLTLKGRELVTGRPNDFPWPPQAVESIDLAISALEEQPIAILFVDKMTAPDDEIRAAFQKVAEAHMNRRDSSLKFAVATDEDSMTGRLRQLLGVARDREGPTNARITVLDGTSGVCYNLEKEEDGLPTEGDIDTFMDNVAQGKVEGKPVG